MTIHRLLATCLGFAVLSSASPAQDTIKDVLADPALDINRPADRARAVKRIQAIEDASRERARAKAQAMGIPMRQERPGGKVIEIVGVDENDDFIINTTNNVNAAISSAAKLVHPAPYNLSGTGVTVGVWDGGGVLTSHQEFTNGSRVTIKDNAGVIYHATHVAGTIAAAGVMANAKGMAFNAKVDSYDWNSDTSEMLNRGATSSGQTDKIYISNHSYGNVAGWDGNTWRGTGTDQNAYAVQFGQYNSGARTWDDVAYKAPYYLVFKSAGNDNSNNPAAGSSVVIGGITVSYDAAIHPKGDGLYRNTTTNATNGYENIPTTGTAKNIVTVGAANDAVTSGLRDPVKSTLTTFSSRGPTDDGRIKPDIVANGASLYSTSDSSSTGYGTSSGTSMSSPSAAGSAALLVQQYSNLFSGGAMLSSTLKGLIIHTATDIGNPGPDYHYGWGLMNTKEAADLIVDHHANPSRNRMIEDQVTTSVTTRSYSFVSDGSAAIRATLCWTDPPGDSTTGHDIRTPTLKNNLNLKLIAPNGNEYFPYVMPFVGTWTVASMSQNATTGINNTDPVEQVLIQNPGLTGNWQAVVSYSGALTNNLQKFSLLFSGVSDGIVPLVLNDIAPNAGTVGSIVTVDISGTALSADTAIRLRKAGRADIIGTSVRMLNATTLSCQFNLTGASSGPWDLVAINPDLETYRLPEAFSISGSLTTIWSENFDGTFTGWSSTSTRGSNSWTITTAQKHTPTKSYFAPAPASATTTYLVSPQISIPSDSTNLQIDFWHWYNLESGLDGGRLSLSLDNGTTWFDVTDTNSGAAFVSNPYNTKMNKAGQVGDFADLFAWSGSSGGFIRTAVSLNDIPKFAGRNLRLRWGLATSTKNASTGWYVDSIALLSDSSMPNQAPVITTAASTDSGETQMVGNTTYHILRGTGTNLSVNTTDDAGEEFLTYTWQSTGPAPVTYSLNGNNAAKNTTASFSAIGDYVITVTALDTGGLFATSTVNVRVLQTAGFVVTPDSIIMSVGQTQQFAATVLDQFGTPLASQPSPISWSTTGGGTIDTAGLFAATSVGGPYTITASGGGESGTAEVSVNPTEAGIELANLSQTYDRSARIATATTSPAGLSHSITYDGQSTAPVNAGSYAVVATITNPNYQGTASGTLVVAKASQTITFAALDPVGDDQPPFALTASATSGLPVSYTSSFPSVASVSGSTVTIHGIGTTTITASQAGNTNYFPATNVPRNLTVFRSNPLAVSGGPYKLLFGESLTLNGSASEPSFEATITSYQWDLNNDDTFGDVTGAMPATISFADLSTLWGIGQGLNTIQLKVTDSAGKTSTVSTTVEIVIGLTWDANSTTANQSDGGGAWLDANRWWNGAANVVWASGSNATFGNGGAGGSVTLASPTRVNAIHVNSCSGTYTLGTAGQAITLSDGITQNTGSAAVTITSPITLGGAQTWTNNGGTLTINAAVDNGGNLLTFDNSGSRITNFGTTASAVISGAGGVTVNGGRVNLGAGLAPVHIYSGVTNLNGGVTMFSNNYSANSNITMNGGVLESYWSTTFTRALGMDNNQVRIIGGESGFSLNGNTGQTINLGGSSAQITWGTADFTPSTFVLQSQYAQGSSNLTFTNPLNLNAANRTIKVNGGVAGSARAVLSGAVSNSSGTAGLIKEGAGMLNFTNTSSAWNGLTTITAGILDFGGINVNTNIGGGSGRNITVAAGAGVRFNNLGNALLNRIVATSEEITVMTGTTANNLDFSGSTGANLPNAFLGTWTSNGAKTEISGTITPAADNYRFGSPIWSSGLLGIRDESPMAGSQGLIVGGGSVELVGPKTFTGDTVIRSGSRLGLAAISGVNGVALGLQNSALDVGSSGGTIWLESAPTGFIVGAVPTTSAVFGGLKGSRDLASVYSTTTGANNSGATPVVSVTGFTLNPGIGKVCEYLGTIAEFGTGTTLTKTGEGTQILNGTNTYSGATTINEGKLRINGSTAGGTVTVNAGATLGGTGILGGNTIIENNGRLEFNIATSSGSHKKLNLASGRTLTFSGASVLTITTTGGAEPGNYTLVTAPGGITGIAPATVNLPEGWLATVSKVGNDLVLNVTSVGGGPGPVDRFVITGVTSQTAVGSTLTGITLTAQDAANETAASFTGTVTFGGTAGITGTSANFNNGVLGNLTITPMIAGNDLTFTVDDGAGHNGAATFTVISIYDNWASGVFANPFLETNPNANPDGDSFVNLLEFAFGTDPTSGTSGPIVYDAGGNVITAGTPVITESSGNYRAVFGRRKNHQAAGLTYIVEFSAGLDAWVAGDEVPVLVTGAESEGEIEAVSVAFPALVPVANGEAKPTFFRVAVSTD